jgi:hypothetical protein
MYFTHVLELIFEFFFEKNLNFPLGERNRLHGVVHSGRPSTTDITVASYLFDGTTYDMVRDRTIVLPYFTQHIIRFSIC